MKIFELFFDEEKNQKLQTGSRISERTARRGKEAVNCWRVQAETARLKNRLTVFAVKPYNLDRLDRFNKNEVRHAGKTLAASRGKE